MECFWLISFSQLLVAPIEIHMTAAKNIWTKWLQRDDRELLAELSAASWNRSLIQNKLSAIIYRAVQTLHFAKSSRMGAPIDTDHLAEQSDGFLNWLETQKEWQSLEASWKESKEGPWSIPFFLFRSYQRYRLEEYPQGISGELTFSMQIAFQELNAPDSQLSGAVMEAFSFMTVGLAEENRLVYQLYLDGLFPSEISMLLGEGEDVVAAKIENAKSELRSQKMEVKLSA